MNQQFPIRPCPPKSCSECAFLDECGGLEAEGFNSGCFKRCTSHCEFKGCDAVCPVVALPFGQYFEDVGGICVPPERKLLPFSSTELPPYIPQINHGGSRSSPLWEPWVTIPLYTVVGRDCRKRYFVRFRSLDELRARFHLSPHTKVILSGVAPDACIEDFWAEHVFKRILEQLAELQFSAMTVPNYSFMTDIPRTNSLYNLSRIFRMSERISEAGIPTMLHINASNPKDWDRWFGVLQEQSHVQTVSMEFQTGLRNKTLAKRFLDRLADLQQRLGRPIHPFVLGGTGQMCEFAKVFSRFTAVDATPFIKTMKRQSLEKAGTRWKWRSSFTSHGKTLNAMLATNISRHRDVQLARIGLGAERLGQQLLLPRAA